MAQLEPKPHSKCLQLEMEMAAVSIVRCCCSAALLLQIKSDSYRHFIEWVTGYCLFMLFKAALSFDLSKFIWKSIQSEWACLLEKAVSLYNLHMVDWIRDGEGDSRAERDGALAPEQHRCTLGCAGWAWSSTLRRRGSAPWQEADARVGWRPQEALPASKNLAGVGI